MARVTSVSRWRLEFFLSASLRNPHPALTYYVPDVHLQMKLYLRRDVASYSYKRWGGEDGLAEEKSRRDGLKYDRSLARTKVRQAFGAEPVPAAYLAAIVRTSDPPGAVSRHPLCESLQETNVGEKIRT